jgi:hypothetical protein
MGTRELQTDLGKYEEMEIWMELLGFDKQGQKLHHVRINSPIGKSDDELRLNVSDKDAEFALASTSSFGQRVGQPWAQESMSSEDYPMRAREVFDPIKQIGNRLFSNLFEGSREILYRRSLEYSKQRGKGLRLRMLISDPELEALPWEFLHDGYDFVNLSANSPLVRTPVRSFDSNPMRPPKPANERLRVLAVASEPGEGCLGAEKDIDLLKSLQDSFPQFELHALCNPPPQQLIETVRSWDFDLFHFNGTGIDVFGDKQELLLVDNRSSENADVNWRLVQELRKKQELQLLFFNASHTGRIAREFAQTVQACTIGIDSTISNLSCLAFAEGIYNGILMGQPLERAVAKGRQSVDKQNPGSREWGLPIFYMPMSSSLFLVKPLETSLEKETKYISEAPETVPLDPVSQRELEKLNRQLKLLYANLNALEAAKKSSYKGNVKKSIASQISEVQKIQQELKVRLDEITSARRR